MPQPLIGLKWFKKHLELKIYMPYMVQKNGIQRQSK